MHIQPFKKSNFGEMTVDDLVLLFHENGPLGNLQRMWTMTKRYCILVDESHSRAVRAYRKTLSTQPAQPSTEDELDLLCLLQMELDALSDSNSLLVKSTVFQLLVSFVEYGRKKIHQFVFPKEPVKKKTGDSRIIKEKLRKKGIIREEPELYREHVSRHIKSVRHNLAHGNWDDLSRELGAVELNQCFAGVCEYFNRMQNNLQELGYDV